MVQCKDDLFLVSVFDFDLSVTSACVSCGEDGVFSKKADTFIHTRYESRVSFHHVIQLVVVYPEAGNFVVNGHGYSGSRLLVLRRFDDVFREHFIDFGPL